MMNTQQAKPDVSAHFRVR